MKLENEIQEETALTVETSAMFTYESVHHFMRDWFVANNAIKKIRQYLTEDEYKSLEGCLYEWNLMLESAKQYFEENE